MMVCDPSVQCFGLECAQENIETELIQVWNKWNESIFVWNIILSKITKYLHLYFEIN